MFKQLAAVATVATLMATTPTFAHEYGWHHRGPGFGPFIALGAVAATAVGIAALTAPRPTVVYAAPPAYYPPPGYYAAPYPPAYYAPPPTGYGQ
jgi:hypothetical protein